MRTLLFVVLIAACGRPEHFVSMTGDDGTVTVSRLDDSEIDALAVRVHERDHHCGGFIVHESYDDAVAAQAVDRGGPDYRLDRGELVQSVLPSLDRERIRDTIRELSAFQNRYYRSDTGAAASLFLRDRWKSLTKRQDVTVELFDQGYPQKSVLMTIPGTTRAKEVVVLGGHLDSIALGGTRMRAPGADDDASGIATLTEIARVLLASNYRPERTIQFMAYAAEEVGLRGSQAIVRDYKKRVVDVVGVLQLDMTNYRGSDRDIWLINDFTSAPQHEFLIALIEAYTGATWGYDACGYACSDHASWTRAGYRASMPFESRSKEMNKKIHTASDVIELSDVNADHAVKFARLGISYAIEMAKGSFGGVLAQAE